MTPPDIYVCFAPCPYRLAMSVDMAASAEEFLDAVPLVRNKQDAYLSLLRLQLEAFQDISMITRLARS